MRQAFTLDRHCPAVAREVTLSGLRSVLADGSTEIVKKTCVNFGTCYEGQSMGQLIALQGCLLGNVEL
jgi:hypothetical protein